LSVTIYVYVDKYTLENTEGAIQNAQYKETGNIGYTRLQKTKQKNTTQYVLDITIRKHTQIT